jgi:hypothetical protein
VVTARLSRKARLNNSGHVIGRSAVNDIDASGARQWHPFVYANGKLTDLEKFHAVSINDLGHIVGYIDGRFNSSGRPLGRKLAMASIDGTFEEIPTPGWEIENVFDIDNAGVIAASASPHLHSNMWDRPRCVLFVPDRPSATPAAASPISA